MYNVVVFSYVHEKQNISTLSYIAFYAIFLSRLLRICVFVVIQMLTIIFTFFNVNVYVQYTGTIL